ncbi:hypothetical protein LCGC14_1116260 [marine sediment metagenome]|uniref:4Fe-4S ferredoxin-type domain-containing protein n=1 Tax=marine sediment metagenome TaxID=412755 RepID=A0A0F9MT71_9ZZZZ
MYPRVKRIKNDKIESTTVNFYTENQSIEFDREACISCGTCSVVCPKSVIFDLKDNKKLLGVGYEDLDKIVIKTHNCCFCGLCISLCPIIGLKDDEPTLLEDCNNCERCFKYCSQINIPESELEEEIFNGRVRDNEILGYYQKAVVAKTADKDVAKVAQNGGITTTLLIHALNTGLVDGVLVSGRDDKWMPKPYVATTPEEILAAAGNRYTMTPSLLSYADAIYESKLEKLAFVGMPCQVKAVRKLQLSQPLSDKYGKIVLIIGLYCSSNYSYELMTKYVQEEQGVPLSELVKVDISKGKFLIYSKDGSVKSSPVRVTGPYKWDSCKYCEDYTGEFSDIGIGSVGAPTDDTNCLLIRSNLGMDLFEDAVAAGKISVEETEVNFPALEKQAKRKKTLAKELKQTTINIPDVGIKTITTEDLMPYIPNPLDCTYCGTCVIMCPFSAIKLKKDDEVVELNDIEIVAKNVVPKLEFNAKKVACKDGKERVMKQYLDAKIEVDWDKCISCFSCAEVCPTESFFRKDIPNTQEKPTYNGIQYSQGIKRRVDFNIDDCINCGSCVNACPKDAITMIIDMIKTSGEFKETFWPEVMYRLKNRQTK